MPHSNCHWSDINEKKYILNHLRVFIHFTHFTIILTTPTLKENLPAILKLTLMSNKEKDQKEFNKLLEWTTLFFSTFASIRNKSGVLGTLWTSTFTACIVFMLFLLLLLTFFRIKWDFSIVPRGIFSTLSSI